MNSTRVPGPVLSQKTSAGLLRVVRVMLAPVGLLGLVRRVRVRRGTAVATVARGMTLSLALCVR